MSGTFRTDEQILTRIEMVRPNDFLGTETGDLIAALSFEAAKSFLKSDATEESFDQWRKSNREAVIAEATNYLEFAVGKMQNERGLSANRSIDHYRAWIWLAFDDETFRRFDDADYGWYGRNQLEIAADILCISDEFKELTA